MDPRHQTDVFLLAWLAAAVLWDVYAVLSWGSEPTISGRVLYWSERWRLGAVMLATAFGVLVGHYLVPQRRGP